MCSSVVSPHFESNHIWKLEKYNKLDNCYAIPIMHVDWPLTPKSNPLWLRWFHREEPRSRIKWHKILLQGVTTKSGILTNFVTYAICMMMWKLFWLLNEWPQEAMNTLRYSRLGTNHAWILGKNYAIYVASSSSATPAEVTFQWILTPQTEQWI